MSDPMYLCASGLFSSYLADTMSPFIEYKVNVGGCVPESILPVLKRFDRYCVGLPKDYACLDAELHALYHGAALLHRNAGVGSLLPFSQRC